MIHAHNVTAGSPYTDHQADSAARRLAAAVLLRAVRDARTRSSYRAPAILWLQTPEAQALAEMLDLRLPDVGEMRRGR